MQMRRLFAVFALVLVAIIQYAVAEPESMSSGSVNSELTQAEARSIAAQLSRQFVDRLYELRTVSEQLTNANSHERAKDDDDSGDSDDTTAKLVNKAARALRPIVKEFANVVGVALPVGPARQLVKATADAVDSLMPLILKYALGI